MFFAAEILVNLKEGESARSVLTFGLVYCNWSQWSYFY